MDLAGQRKLSLCEQKEPTKLSNPKIIKSKSKVNSSSETKQMSKSFIVKREISISYTHELFPIKKDLSKITRILKEISLILNNVKKYNQVTVNE